jgi:hypothetical protein
MIIVLVKTWDVASQPPIQPKNEQVIGTLVNTEGEMIINSSGKTGYNYSPVVTVQYKVPEGILTMRGAYGVVYPNEAILYKN